jgi:hypothetical protein
LYRADRGLPERETDIKTDTIENVFGKKKNFVGRKTTCFEYENMF